MTKSPGGLIPSSPEAVLSPLFQTSPLRHLKAGERLFASGDPSDGCYRLDKGVVKVSIASSGGEERIIAVIGPGAIVGELSMIDGQPRSASVVALQDCTLRFASRSAFDEFANTNAETYQALLTILATRLRQVDEALAATSFTTVRARVARALLILAQHLGESSSAGQVVLKERISQADLAAMAGVARENVSRVLSDWRRRKLVTGSGRGLCLKNMGALKREMNAGRRQGPGRTPSRPRVPKTREPDDDTKVTHALLDRLNDHGEIFETGDERRRLKNHA